jgi:hypothetical protein
MESFLDPHLSSPPGLISQGSGTKQERRGKFSSPHGDIADKGKTFQEKS